MLKRVIAIVSCVILVASGVMVGFWGFLRATEGLDFYVFYFNPQTHRLEPERRRIPEGEPAEMARAALQNFVDEPRSSALRRTIPDDLTFNNNLRLNGKTLEVCFPANYFYMQPLEEALFRAALVYTMVNLPFIDGVRVQVDGEELLSIFGEPFGTALVNADGETLLYRETGETVRVGPLLNPSLPMYRNVTLYFPSSYMDGLISVERTLRVNPELPPERFILEYLITAEPPEGAENHIPEGTVIRSVRTDNRIAFINLSDEFSSQFSGSATLAELTLQSIIHSIAANSSNVDSVRFLIDSARRESFNGVPHFNTLFEPDETLIPRLPEDEEDE